MPPRFRSAVTKLLCWGCFLGLVLLSPMAALASGAPSDPSSPAYRGFFPPPLSKGELPITLVPHPLATGKVVPVSFGVPFPPGYVSDPKNIALFDGTGQEMPIRVTVLARWQPPVPGAPSLRAVLVQYLDLMATRVPPCLQAALGQPPPENRAPEMARRSGLVLGERQILPPLQSQGPSGVGPAARHLAVPVPGQGQAGAGRQVSRV